MYNVRTIRSLLLAGIFGFTGLLAGCGGGGAAGTTTTGGTTTGGSTSTTTSSPTLTITLTDSSTNATLTTLSSGVVGKLTVTVKDANGAVVPNALVSFTTDSVYGAFNPASGTTLTDSQGTATMLITGTSTSGASTAKATAVWNANDADVTVSGSVNYIVSAVAPVALTVSAPVFGASPLSAYGTTSVSVTVGGTTSPLNVSFSSPCALSGKAVLSTNVTTIGGVAVASYRDNGCGNLDVVTASISAGNASSSTLTVSPPSAGSIQFVEATPTVISLKGTGSVSLPESSTVKFKILDTAGNPISKPVSFSLSTSLGGVVFSNGLSTANASSDAGNGEVQVVVNAGTLPTPVRVLANITGTSIQTQSNQLTVTTGLPSQANLSLSATSLNIDGWQHDGTQTTLTMRLSDSNSNPVPDGTTVNFVSEGAHVDGSCTTTDSKCSVVFTSKDLRPNDGRVTVLAYAVGVESFTDLNSNGTVDNASEMIDANGFSTDIGEAYIDFNENGIRDGASEPYFDFDNSGDYRSGGDGSYNGILCTSGALICSATKKSIHVNKSIVIVLSDSQPVSSGANSLFSNLLGIPIDLGGCGSSGAPPVVDGSNSGKLTSFNLIVRDLHNNPLPAGTVVSVTSTNGVVQVGGSAVVPNTTLSFSTDPTSPAFLFPVAIKNDASPADNSCTDGTPFGILTVSIKPPVGPKVDYSISVAN